YAWSGASNKNGGRGAGPSLVPTRQLPKPDAQQASPITNDRFRPIAVISAVRQAGRMRTTVPPPFSMSFIGPEGPYTIQFHPTGEWDGVINVSMAGIEMRWDVDDADRGEAGGLVLGGITR